MTQWTCVLHAELSYFIHKKEEKCEIVRNNHDTYLL
jgi:hypothetical protein